MKRTDRSVDNIQPLEIQLGTGRWHVASHTAEGLVLEEDSNCGTGRYMQGGLLMPF